MKRLPVIIASLSLILSSGCAYHGAVYSEYAQFALDVRTTAESSAPVKVNLGYDRGVMTFVPKLKGKTGEACSIISWQDIGSTVVPSKTATDSVLRVDAGFISGMAAEVAAVPSDYTVAIVPPDPQGKAAGLKLKTTSGPGERIATALAFAPATVTVLSSKLANRRVALARVLGTFDGAKANRVLSAAGFPAAPADQAVTALQDRILEAQTEEAVKKLENAFKTVQ